MKAAARQSLNCIKNKNNKKWRKTIFNMADAILTPFNVARSRHRFRQVNALCNVACGSGIVTVNSPSGSTLQCDTWLLGWHAIEFAQTSAILEFYIWFPFPHITAVDMSFCTSLRKFYPNRTTLGRKK